MVSWWDDPHPLKRIWHRFQDWIDSIADRTKASDKWYW